MRIEDCLLNKYVQSMIDELRQIRSYSSADDYIKSFDYKNLNRVKRRIVQSFAKKTYYLAREYKLLIYFSDWHKNYDYIRPLISCVNKFQDKFVCLTFNEDIVGDLL